MSEEIFAHILNKAWNNRMVDPSEIFIDGTHIKASANKKKYQKEQAAKTAKIYQEQLRKEVAAERESLGKKPSKQDDDVTKRFPEVEYIAMDSAYKTPWIAKKILDDNRIPILPYTHKTGKKDRYRPWDYIYDPAADSFTCPQGETLRHTTTSKDGKRTYRSTPKECRGCPCCEKCGANAKGQKILQTHIWQEYLDLMEQIRLFHICFCISFIVMLKHPFSFLENGCSLTG